MRDTSLACRGDCVHVGPSDERHVGAECQRDRNIATVIQAADILACEEKVGFYYTARGKAISQEMLDTLAITQEQVDEVRANVPAQLEEAEATLKG